VTLVFVDMHYEIFLYCWSPIAEGIHYKTSFTKFLNHNIAIMVCNYCMHYCFFL